MFISYHGPMYMHVSINVRRTDLDQCLVLDPTLGCYEVSTQAKLIIIFLQQMLLSRVEADVYTDTATV